MRGIFNELAAEFVVGHIFGHAQQIPTHTASNVNHQWNHAVSPLRVAGKTVGILGVGEMGNEVARLCKAVGMSVLGYTRSSEGSAHVDQYFHGQEELLQMVPMVDYLISILPNTPESSNILHRGVFVRMKATCVIINLGRGTAIVDDDLLEAIQHGTIGGAVLDVLRHEPLPEDHPFWKERNILITSHTAAKTIPREAVKVFVANYERFRHGEDLKYRIDFTRGY
jgi:phosphoglycerate dehydrogenase-like enzyme